MEEDRKPKYMSDGCCCLKFEVMLVNRPAMIAAPFWAQATAEGEICGQGNCGHIQISAKGLIPCGVYTASFITDKGNFPAGPREADYTGGGMFPNTLVVNSEGTLSYYVAPLDFNPLKGIPTTTGCIKITGVAISLHSNCCPGMPEEDVNDQLIAPMCCLRE